MLREHPQVLWELGNMLNCFGNKETLVNAKLTMPSLSKRMLEGSQAPQLMLCMSMPANN